MRTHLVPLTFTVNPGMSTTVVGGLIYRNLWPSLDG